MPSSSEDLDMLLADIAAATEALRSASVAEVPNVGRKLLADLTRVAARLRADAAAVGESLHGVLDSPRDEPDAAGDT